MLNKQFTEMLNEKDIIFEIAGVAQQRAQVVGAENVYNFSLGGPSVPAPEAVREAIIRLTYKDTERRPTHIIISCTSSKLGDYLTGSYNSTLWVDNFELIYDEQVVTE